MPALAIFWYFGKDLEDNLLGRSRRCSSSSPRHAALRGRLGRALRDLADGSVVLDHGLNTVELVILLAWIAEWPQRRFMFNIPAWVFGSGDRRADAHRTSSTASWFYGALPGRRARGLAIIARSLGMLSGAPHRPAHPAPPSVAAGEAAARPAARRGTRRPRIPASSPDRGRGARRPAESRDEARMNALLEKIHATGQDSLSEAEKSELLALRDRLRRR
jgi:hypothetical protein